MTEFARKSSDIDRYVPSDQNIDEGNFLQNEDSAVLEYYLQMDPNCSTTMGRLSKDVLDKRAREKQSVK